MTTNLADVIARVKEARDWLVGSGPPSVPITADDLTAILDAAEAGMKARDAALEEAASIADDMRHEWCSPGDYTDGWRGACRAIDKAIRALKVKP